MIENLRLKELIEIVKANRAFYEEFVQHLQNHDYSSIARFVAEPSDNKALAVIRSYLEHRFHAVLHDGLGRPYAVSDANWYFLAWVLRDAPVQRLQPLLKSVPVNEVRKFIGPLLPDAEHWRWPVISEVLLARLEGSRRALKGTIFENIIRQCLRELLEVQSIPLQVRDQGIQIAGETYDVVVIGKTNSILMPVKTRETMGGGHALLFTRDIHKSISAAKKQNYICIPVIIAESWSGNLKALNADRYVYIEANPNQIELVTSRLQAEFAKLLPLFRDLATRT